MFREDSVSEWLDQLKRGEDSAAQKIWERYFQRLIAVARGRLGQNRRRVSDEDDVVATAFEQFWLGVQTCRFPRLDDRHDLWRLLVRLTDRRAADAVRRFERRRRHEVGESALGRAEAKSELADLRQIVDREPTPEFAAELIEDFERLLDRLEDDTLRNVAVWKMQGFTNNEIAAKLGCVERTVERKLRLIRKRLSDAEEIADAVCQGA